MEIAVDTLNARREEVTAFLRRIVVQCPDDVAARLAAAQLERPAPGLEQHLYDWETS